VRCEAAERECARAPLIGIRFADGLSAGGYEGVGLAEGEARAAKRPQGHAREPERSELTSKVEWAQVIHYLRATRIPYALLVNFGRSEIQYETFELARLPSI
jgi:hypothetical protein